MLYYDGHFDDARLNITLITTAALAGAVVLNHVSCTNLIKAHIKCKNFSALISATLGGWQGDWGSREKWTEWGGM